MTCTRTYHFQWIAESYLKPGILTLTAALFPFTTFVKSSVSWEEVSEGFETQNHLGRSYGLDEGQRDWWQRHELWECFSEIKIWGEKSWTKMMKTGIGEDEINKDTFQRLLSKAGSRSLCLKAPGRSRRQWGRQMFSYWFVSTGLGCSFTVGSIGRHSA